MPSVFITGNSNGLGLGLTHHYLQQDFSVYGLSRSPCPAEHALLHQATQDLADLEQISPCLAGLLPQSLDLVILNAGILGQIQDLNETSMDAVKQLMDVNVWANKVIIDWLIQHQVEVNQLILISSGASINGNRGWGAYSLSKASINMMAKLYAHEMPSTHITAYAPGLVHTQMQDYLCNEVNTEKYPSIQHLVNAYHTADMPSIDVAASNIAQSFAACRQYPSGEFVDIRQLTSTAS